MKTTEENNRLIAEFMGFHEIMLDEENRYDIDDIYDILEIDIVAIGTVAVSDFEFHNNWSWLMPIVEKIESLGYTVNISRITTSISEMGNEETMFSWVCGDVSKKLEITYNTVVQFIEWYNEQTK